jgi:hypothetical protein
MTPHKARDALERANLFAPLPVIGGGFSCAHADPPWGFEHRQARPQRDAALSLPLPEANRLAADQGRYGEGRFLLPLGSRPLPCRGRTSTRARFTGD